MEEKIITQCKQCKSKFKLDKEKIGTKIRCPKCSSVFEVTDISGNSYVTPDNTLIKPKIPAKAENMKETIIYIGAEEGSIININSHPEFDEYPEFNEMDYEEQDKVWLSQAKALVNFFMRTIPSTTFSRFIAELLISPFAYDKIEKYMGELSPTMRKRASVIANKVLKERGGSNW